MGFIGICRSVLLCLMGGRGEYPIYSWLGVFHRGGVPHPVLAGGREGTPSSPGWGGGVPHPVLAEGVTWSTPIQTWDGVPPVSWMGYPPPSRPGMGYPLTWTWNGVPPPPNQLDGVPPPSRPGTWYPPPPPPPPSRCELTNKLKTVPSPILWMRVVIICRFLGRQYGQTVSNIITIRIGLQFFQTSLKSPNTKSNFTYAG